MAEDFLVAPEWADKLPRVSFMTFSRQKKLVREQYKTISFGVSLLTCDEWPAEEARSFKSDLVFNLGWFFVNIGLGKLK